MLNQTEGRSSGHQVIDAHKSLVCYGFQYTYHLDGSYSEITPPGEAGSGSCKSLLTRGHIQMTDFSLVFHLDIDCTCRMPATAFSAST